MANYEILISPEFVGRYMEEHGADSESIEAMYRHIEPLEDIAPDKLVTLAIVVLNSMKESAALQIAEDYGCEPYGADKYCIKWSDALIGHIADEILDECCRTVLDF